MSGGAEWLFLSLNWKKKTHPWYLFLSPVYYYYTDYMIIWYDGQLVFIPWWTRTQPESIWSQFQSGSGTSLHVYNTGNGRMVLSPSTIVSIFVPPFFFAACCVAVTAASQGNISHAYMALYIFLLRCSTQSVNSYTKRVAAVYSKRYSQFMGLSVGKWGSDPVRTLSSLLTYCAEKVIYITVMLHRVMAVENLFLTHWGRDKMAAIFRTTFSNAFSWMKMLQFPRFELTIFQHCFR